MSVPSCAGSHTLSRLAPPSPAWPPGTGTCCSVHAVPLFNCLKREPSVAVPAFWEQVVGDTRQLKMRLLKDSALEEASNPQERCCGHRNLQRGSSDGAGARDEWQRAQICTACSAPPGAEVRPCRAFPQAPPGPGPEAPRALGAGTVSPHPLISGRPPRPTTTLAGSC